MTQEERVPVEGAADDSVEVSAGRRGDPLARWLLGVVGLMLLVFVAAAVSLVLYVLSMRNAPRTAVERATYAGEVAVKERPQVIENWARLALAYAREKRWSEALNAVERGRRVKKAAILDLTAADILRMKRDPGAIAAYDVAIKNGQAEYEASAKELREKKGVTAPSPNSLVFEAMFGRALALSDAGRTEEAVRQAREALELRDTDADLHSALGDMLLKLGRKSEAVKEYRQALDFVPDMQSARDGLKRAGEEN